MMRHYVFISLIFLISCGEYLSNWDTKENVDNKIIIECMLTNEYKKQLVKISRTREKPGVPAPVVNEAIVILYENEKAYYFHENEPGLYYSDSLFAGVVGINYFLNINIDNISYSANAEMLPVTEFEPISYSKSVTDDSLYILNGISTTYSNNETSMFEVLLDWSFLPGYDTVNGKAKILYYHIPFIDIPMIFAPAKELIQVPVGTKIIHRKYSINEKHTAFIRSLLMETEWRGGYFDATQGNVLTNFSSGALGYFSASTVLSKELIIMPK